MNEEIVLYTNPIDDALMPKPQGRLNQPASPQDAGQAKATSRSPACPARSGSIDLPARVAGGLSIVCPMVAPNALIASCTR